MMKIKTANLERIKPGLARKEKDRIRVKYDFDIVEKASEFSPNLDIRGQRAEEALVKARRFVDDAILLGVKQLKIVHGTGDGILREALRDYLQTLSEVKRARDEHPDRGGVGSTIIEMK
jgi:DNA mismatch repair protein MutS2